MPGKSLRARYIQGTIIQYRDGQQKIKTADGLVPLARVVATTSAKVVNGGEELQKGWRVMHLDMSSFGQKDHDRPENLAVIKCRNTKFEFLKAARILFEPKPTAKSAEFLRKSTVAR